MPIELLVSPAAAGKTAACIQRIRALAGARPFAPIWAILPDRLQIAYFRRRLARAGGSIGVRVASFGDLYQEILACAQRPAPVASAPMLHRLAQASIAAESAQEPLAHFAAVQDTPGFAQVCRDAFAELKRALVYPDTFLRQAATPAQHELARIYQNYQERLQSLGWADPEGLSWLAVEALRDQPHSAPEIALLVVDGFDSFSGAQREALRLLSETVENILITLPGEAPFQRIPHRRFAAAHRELVSQLAADATALPGLPHLPPALQRIEAHVFTPTPDPADPGESLALLEARSPAEEAREALRWLKTRILRDGVALQSCALVTPSPVTYRPFLRQVSAEYGIPLEFTQGETLAQSPGIAALLELLELTLRNTPRRALLNVLRSPYFDLTAIGLDARAADSLDLVSLAGQVIEGRGQWDQVLARLAQAVRAPDLPADEESDTPSLPRGAAAARLQHCLDDFLERIQPPGPPQSMRAWIAWLEDLIDDLHVESSGWGERDATAFVNFREALGALLVSETVAASAPIDYAYFVSELQATLAGVGYQELPPGKQPAVQVLRMLEARGLRYEAVVVMGLSEGIFPEMERADPFLDEDLRERLGLESRLQREQAGLFYQALTRAERFLCLTRPYLADDGEEWEASPYWKAVQALVPVETVRRIRPDDPRPMADAASAQEALFWAARRGAGLPPVFAGLSQRWEQILHAHRVLAARRAPDPDSPYEGRAAALEAQLAQRFGPDHLWSSSRLESYATCPLQFYVTSALKLEAKRPPELGLDAAQLGSLMHAILERLYASAADPADLPSLLDALPGVAAQVFASAPDELGFRPSPLWQTEQVQILAALHRSVQGLAALDAQSGWVPVAFELSFGRAGRPALQVETGGRSLKLAGVIDRVDRDAAGRIRIIDYKTGSSHLGKADLVSGRRLQLPIYALAAQNTTPYGRPVEGIYWALLRAEAGSLRLSRFEHEESTGLEGAVQLALQHIDHIVQAVLQANFSPSPPRGGCPAYCPASAWCWRYSGEWRAA